MHAGIVRASRDGVPSSLRPWLEVSLAQLARNTLPFLNAAHRRPERFLEADRACDVFMTQAVSKRASMTQGRAFFATCERSFPCDALRSARAEAEARQAPQHFAVVFGAALRFLGVGEEESRAMLVHTSARGALSAAVRLGLVGPYEAQRLQRAVSDLQSAVVARAADFDLDDAAQTAPLFETVQGMHDRLYSRLFQS
jgi:urease accessory protein